MRIKNFIAICIVVVLRSSAFAQSTQNIITGPTPPPSIHPNTVESSPILISKKDAPGKEQSMVVETNTIADNVAGTTNYSRFYQLVELAGLWETFKSAGPITIFLPENAAFDKLPKGKLDTLTHSYEQLQLVAFLTYYAIPGKLAAKDIAKQINRHKGLASLKTISGAPLKAKLDGNHNIVLIDEYGNEATVTKANIHQSNGMMFIISDVLMPKKRMY